MPHSAFASWLARTLHQQPAEVAMLLGDTTAVEFLLSWSLFEARYFGTLMKLNGLVEYANRVANAERFAIEHIEANFLYFHARYQDQRMYRALIHGKDFAPAKEVLRKPADGASNSEKLMFCTFVAYRYRNNIFHGSKGVRSWLAYREQIERCSSVLQLSVSHAEVRSPELALPSKSAA